MLSRKRGAIVNIGSAAGVSTSPLLAQYGAAKVTYINRYMYIYIYAYAYICVSVFAYGCIHLWILGLQLGSTSPLWAQYGVAKVIYEYFCMCIFMLHICVYIYIYIRTFMYMYLDLDVNIYIYICIYIVSTSPLLAQYGAAKVTNSCICTFTYIYVHITRGVSL
jgi:hypothetical protein